MCGLYANISQVHSHTQRLAELPVRLAEMCGKMAVPSEDRWPLVTPGGDGTEVSAV